MKDKRWMFVFLAPLVFVAAFIPFSCRNNVDSSTSSENPEMLPANPIHISWIEQPEDLESYMADVDVFAMNSLKRGI